MFRVYEIVKAVGGQLVCGRRQLRINGVSIDSRSIKSGQLFIAIRGARFDGHDFIQQAVKKGARAVMVALDRLRRSAIQSKAAGVDKGVAYIGVADTRLALAELARFHRQRFNIPVIAVTGSNGKTTTKDMLAWILSSRARVLKNPGTQNNDIGVPLALLKLNASYDIAVLELGSNHFGEIAYLADIARPQLGIITNISPAHLEYFRSLAGVYKEKISLLEWLRPPAIAVLNADEPWLGKPQINKKIFNITYGINNKSDFSASAIRLTDKGRLRFSLNSSMPGAVFTSCLPGRRIELNTIGYANIYNALAAIAAARLLGWDYQSISRRLARFVFSPGRLSLIKLNGIRFIDDSYNANPASLAQALGVLARFRVKGRRILVMGDMLELGRSAASLHRQAGKLAAGICDVFIGVGRLAKLAAAQAFNSGLSRKRIFTCRNSVQAGKLIRKLIKPGAGDLVLVKGSRLMRMEEVLKARG